MPTQSGAQLSSALLKPDGASLAPGSARSLLMTILGELVWPTGQPAWTSALVYVLRGLGVEEQAARRIARAIWRGISGEPSSRESSSRSETRFWS